MTTADDLLDAVLFSQIQQLASPRHGWVQGGTLHLPNGATLTYPQPSYREDDTVGQTFLSKKNGAPPVVRSPEELAADTAAGLEWRNCGTIAGGYHQIRGTDTNGWIWWDANGRVWHVSCPEIMEGTVVFGAAATLHITLKLFGYFGELPESHAYTVTLSDLGQSGGTVNAQDGGTSPAPITTGKIRIDDIKPDGSAALLMLHYYRGTYRQNSVTDKDPMIRWPLGWLELTLSGLGESATIDLTVARSRAQTLAVTRDAVPSIDNWSAGIVATGGGGFAFYLNTTGDPENQTDELVAVQEGEWSYQANRLLALRYGTAGAIEEVALRIDWSGVASFPQVTQTPGIWRQERDFSASAEWTVSLLNAGIAVDALSGTWTVGGNSFVEWTFSGTTVSSGSVSAYGQTTTETTTFMGETQSRTWEQDFLFVQVPMGAFRAVGGFNARRRGLVSGYANLHDCSPSDFFDLCCSCPAWEVYMPYGNVPFVGPDTYTGEISRQSTQVIGMRIHHQLSSDPIIAGGGSWDYRPAATPSGSYGASTTRAFVAGGERLFASHDAYSGQVRWLNATPVCWV